MKEITKDLLKEISEWNGEFKGAYNIREDGACVGRVSSKNIRIESKKDQPGLEIFIAANTKGETVSIPACVTHGDVDDLILVVIPQIVAPRGLKLRGDNVVSWL